MRIRGCVLILALFAQLNSYGQALPTRKEQYDFLVWYLKKNDLKQLLDTTVSFSIGSLTIKEIDQTLSSSFRIDKVGRLYINRQIKSNIPVALDTSVLKEVNWKKDKDDNSMKGYCLQKAIYPCQYFQKIEKWFS